MFLSEIQGRSKWSDGVFTGIWSADPGDGVLSVRLFPVGMALGAVLWRKLAAAGGMCEGLVRGLQSRVLGAAAGFGAISPLRSGSCLSSICSWPGTKERLCASCLRIRSESCMAGRVFQL